MRSPAATLIGVHLLVVGTLACGGGDAVSTTTVRDSAGVQIVESSAAQWDSARAWRLSAAPTVSIGELEGDANYLLDRVVGAMRLPGGGIVIGNGGTNQLRFYTARGEFRHAVGREGGGPGEYEYMRDLKRCATDSIFAFDLHWGVKVYDTAGGLARETRLEEPGASGRTPYDLNCSSDGRFIMTGWGQQTLRPVVGFYTATGPAYVLDRGGDVILELGEFTSSERIGTERGSSPHPFSRSAVLALDTGAVYIGTNGGFEVREYGLDGTLRRLLRGPPLDLEIRPEHLAAYRESQIANVPDENRPAMERWLRDMPMTAHFPVYTEFQIDPGGNLWMRRFLPPGRTQPFWSVFGPDGGYLGEVTTPPDFTVLEIGDDYVLGIHRDELDVQRVQLYELLKPNYP